MGVFKKEEPTSFLGIDLSHDAIKVVELKSFQGKPQLATYGYSELKDSILKGSLIDNTNVTATLLNEVCERAGCVSRKAVAALPTAKTFSYVVRVQSIKREDLFNETKVKSLLSKEVTKILPQEQSDMQFDYTILHKEQYLKMKNDEVARDVKFLITAATNALVKQYSDIFARAGIELVSLDIEAFALVRALMGNDQSLMMMVDFGENTTNLSIIDAGVPVFNRSIEVGGALITKQLSDALGISIEEAEQYKVDLPILMQQQSLTEMPRPIVQAVSPIVKEMKYLIESYYEQVSKEKSVDRVILTGGSALLAGFNEFVEKELDIRTFIGDPWARIIYPQELKDLLAEIGPRMSIAIGLAMTNIK
jgi:type IV pilus assembly protein PilM